MGSKYDRDITKNISAKTNSKCISHFTKHFYLLPNNQYIVTGLFFVGMFNI